LIYKAAKSTSKTIAAEIYSPQLLFFCPKVSSPILSDNHNFNEHRRQQATISIIHLLSILLGIADSKELAAKVTAT